MRQRDIEREEKAMKNIKNKTNLMIFRAEFDQVY